MMTSPQHLAYLMAPVSPSNGRTLEENLATAEAWLVFLRALLKDQHVSVIAPWLASIRAGADEKDEEQRKQGLLDDCTTAARCDFVIACGYHPMDDLTSGMRLEREACSGPCVNLMDMGSTWAWPVSMMDADRAEIIKRVQDVLSRLRGQVREILCTPHPLAPVGTDALTPTEIRVADAGGRLVVDADGYGTVYPSRADARALEGLREVVRDIEQAFGSRGCGNLPCYFRVARSPGGQHTNGHCSCLETLHDGHSGRMKARALVRLFQAVKAAVKATE